MSTPLRCVILNRVSSDKQEEGVSLETQRQENQAYVERMGHTTVAVFDEVISGALYLHRLKLQSALEMIENKQADAIVTFDLSRYSRHSLYQQTLLERLERCGGRFLCTTLPLEYDEFNEMTPESSMVYGTSGTFAEYHRRKIRADTMRGRRGVASKGKVPGTSAPVGLRIISRNDVIRGTHPAEKRGDYELDNAPVLGFDGLPHPSGLSRHQFARLLFELIDEGHSLQSLMKWLYANGYATTKGKREWREGTLLRILQKSAYRGAAVFHATRIVHDEARARERGLKLTYYYVARPIEQQNTISCPVIVPPDLWDRVQVKLSEGRKYRSGNPQRRKMLAGLLVCPKCGIRMTGERRIQTHKKMTKAYGLKTYEVPAHFYHCRYSRPSRRPSGEVCTPTRYNGPMLEGRVLKLIQSLASDKERVRKIVASEAPLKLVPHSPESEQARRKQINAALKVLDSEESNIVDAQIAGIAAGASTDVYIRKLNDLASKRKALEAQLEEMNARKEKTATMEKSAERAYNQMCEIAVALEDESLDDDEKRGYIQQVFESISPHPNGFISVKLRV